MIYIVIILTIFMFFMGGIGRNTYGKLGGWLSGILCGFFLSPLYRNRGQENMVTINQFQLTKQEKVIFWIGILLYVLMITLYIFFM